MTKAYSDDRRRELLQAYDRGEGTLQQLAERFQVSVAWAWKISAQRKSSGQMERAEQRRGGRRKVTADVEEGVCWGLSRYPDIEPGGITVAGSKPLRSACQHWNTV
jgi:transposase